MLPAFQENGLLPAGVHHSDLSGFEEAFAWNAHRRRIYAQMQREKAHIPMTFACNVVLAAFVSLGTADG